MRNFLRIPVVIFTLNSYDIPSEPRQEVGCGLRGAGGCADVFLSMIVADANAASVMVGT